MSAYNFNSNPLMQKALENNPNIANQIANLNQQNIQPQKLPTITGAINSQIKMVINNSENPIATITEWVNVFTLHEHGNIGQNQNFANFLYMIHMTPLVNNKQIQGAFYESPFSQYNPNFSPPQQPQEWVRNQASAQTSPVQQIIPAQQVQQEVLPVVPAQNNQAFQKINKKEANKDEK